MFSQDPPPPPPVQGCGVEEKLVTELLTLTGLYHILEQRERAQIKSFRASQTGPLSQGSVEAVL